MSEPNPLTIVSVEPVFRVPWLEATVLEQFSTGGGFYVYMASLWAKRYIVTLQSGKKIDLPVDVYLSNRSDYEVGKICNVKDPSKFETDYVLSPSLKAGLVCGFLGLAFGVIALAIFFALTMQY